jgi:dihydroorotate dehydrogenase electron transfer subunit
MANLLDKSRGSSRLFYGERLGQSLIDQAYLSSFSPDFLAATEDGLGYGQKGRVTDLLIKALQQEKRDIFACGPPGLLAALAPIAKDNQVRYYASAEAFMACGLGVCLSCSRSRLDGTRLRLCQKGPVVDGLKFDWNQP